MSFIARLIKTYNLPAAARVLRHELLTGTISTIELTAHGRGRTETKLEGTDTHGNSWGTRSLMSLASIQNMHHGSLPDYAGRDGQFILRRNGKDIALPLEDVVATCLRKYNDFEFRREDTEMNTKFILNIKH